MLELGQESSTASWVAAFGQAARSEAHRATAPAAAGRVDQGPAAGPSGALRLRGDPTAPLPGRAEAQSCQVIFDGALYNRAELQQRLNVGSGPPLDDADLLLQAYLRWGDQVLSAIKGIFALCIWDGRSDHLLCARDQAGIYSLFYAESGEELLLSTSVDALLQQPGVSRQVNRAALVDHLCLRWPVLDETFFGAVRRLPPGHALLIERSGRRVYRYWQPLTDDRPIDWASADDLEQFEALMEQAVARCLTLGPAAIFLSGGIDSVAVATAAADVARRQRGPAPLALSLVFPDESEEVVQRGVASELGLPQVVATVAEAVGPRGLIQSLLELGAERPAPLLGAWYPAYRYLALEGKRRGCQTILTGHGGDEWLDISPYYAADLVRAFDLAGLYRLWDSQRHSYSLPATGVARNVLWRFGLRPVLGAAGRDALRRLGPGLVRKRWRQRFLRQLPAWLAPEPELRAELYRRYEQSISLPGREGSYLHDLRRSLDHARGALEFDEYCETGRRLGVRLLHPFWDVDLLEFLIRVPPLLLYRGGRSKSFVRQRLARRFPGLGFDQQSKVISRGYFTSVNLEEGRAAWQQLGGTPALAKLGIVDSAAFEAHLPRLFRDARMVDAYRLRGILVAETWLRPRVV